SGSLSGTLDGEKRLDHYDKSDSTIHHAETATAVFDGYTLTFVDDGSVVGDTSGDGVYTARVDLTDPTQGEADGYVDDHFLLNITVTDSTVGTEYTYVLVNGVRCHAGASHGTHAGGTSNDICAACHFGYEHFYENVSGTIPNSMLDVHFGRMNPATVIDDDKGFGDWDWNASYTGGTKITGAEWGSVIPGSRYCYACHVKSGNILDYGNAGRTDNTDVPTCNDAACHSTTEMEGSSSAAWSPAGMIATGYQNYDIYKAKSHNYSSATLGIPCATCHNGPHGLTMPNMSADISSNGDVSDQCETCHDRSDGWINVTGNVPHPLTSPCKNCHLENNKLDAHLVPIGVFGGKWCMNCHIINGKSPISLDDEVTNSSNPDYIHYELNSGSDATNASRLCWGCHTNDSVAGGGVVNQGELPESTHPDGFDTPKACLDCHYNTGSTNFSAPQNYRH
ncbi:MAG: hypothetical protein KAJ55_05665, partial [Anaerolineales bacterium]|nr:hypothetical protein [Anaerolineales bacterium]